MWLGISWDQWVVLLVGVPAILMTQVDALSRYACFPGLLGQCGWLGGIENAQVGFLVASVLMCLIWVYSLWKHWGSRLWRLCSELDSATTPTGVSGIAPALPSRNRPKKPRLRLVRRVDG